MEHAENKIKEEEEKRSCTYFLTTLSVS